MFESHNVFYYEILSFMDPLQDVRNGQNSTLKKRGVEIPASLSQGTQLQN